MPKSVIFASETNSVVMSAYLPKSSTETDFATAAINRNPSPALNTFPIPTNEILVIDFEDID